jgi:elongation of very long chain fatty acids protein 6
MPVLQWMQQHPIVPVATCVAYLVIVFAGQAYMQQRPQQLWQWRIPLAAWNLLLSLFSFIGVLRTAPQLLHNLTVYSWRDNLCLDPRATFGSGSTGLWVQLFILSKFPELLDTFFIVIHKKPLIFLHWYHHVTVLLYCWHSYVTKSPPGIFFVVMNYAVHSSMYGYYFLMAMKWRPKWFNPVVITAFQISQMVVGVAVTLVGFYYYQTDSAKTCHYLDAENNTAAFVMYGSYLFLFLQFFFGRYGVRTGTSKKLKSV